MKSIKGKISIGLALLATLFVAGTTGVKEVAADEVAAPISSTVWVARTVDQVKVDLDKMVDNTYTIVTGDTLSVLGEATGIPFVEIAQKNGIEDVDFIVAGDKLVFDKDGRSVTIKDSTGETKTQIATPGAQGNNNGSSNTNGGGAGNTGNGSDNSTTNPPTNGDNSGGNDNGTATPPAGDDNGQTTPDREITKVIVSENEMFTRFRVGPFLNTDEASNWVRENYPNGLKGYEVHQDGDYIYIEFEVGKGDQGTPDGGDNGSGGGETTPPGGGDNGSGGGEEDVDNIPVNIGNSGIFAATEAEANAQAYALWAEGKFTEYTRFVVGPALNAKGDIIGYTVNFR